nr:DUF4352 domain-containing protein [Rhizohabitans arisaemae]
MSCAAFFTAVGFGDQEVVTSPDLAAPAAPALPAPIPPAPVVSTSDPAPVAPAPVVSTSDPVPAAPVPVLSTATTVNPPPPPAAQPSPQPSTRPSTQPRQPQPARVGAALTLRGRDPNLRVSVTLTRVIQRATTDNQFMAAKAGFRLVAVELVLHNISQVVLSDLPRLGADLIDERGQQYQPTYADVTEGQSLPSITVSPGDSRRGLIVFEFPENAKPTKFQFELNGGFASQTGEWVIDP